MYNQTLPHRDKAWTQVSWHSKNGTQPSFLVRTKGNSSDCLIISKIRQVACISRHHFLFLSGSSFQWNTCYSIRYGALMWCNQSLVWHCLQKINSYSTLSRVVISICIVNINHSENFLHKLWTQLIPSGCSFINTTCCFAMYIQYMYGFTLHRI